LYSLDASAIDLSLELFPWAAHRDDTANVKLSVALSDQIIELTSAQAMKRNAPKLRLVRYMDFKTDKVYELLTNHYKLASTTIAAIYKDRRQVELFFKAIKQQSICRSIEKCCFDVNMDRHDYLFTSVFC